ncbi:hypothetical protein [Rickettsia conorii]
MATWVMIACRMAQGMSSMGKVIGADVYLTEFIKPTCTISNCSNFR